MVEQIYDINLVGALHYVWIKVESKNININHDVNCLNASYFEKGRQLKLNNSLTGL